MFVESAKMKVSILGGGNAAYAQAFHLVQMGHEVLMQVPEPFKEEIQGVIDSGSCIESLKEHNGVESNLHGVSKIDKLTTDIKEAAEYSNILMIPIPSFGHRSVYQALLPHLTGDHIVVNLPGNFAFLEVTQVAKEKGDLDVTKDLPFSIVEASSISYACRKAGGNKVFISGVKAGMFFGVYPSSRTNQILERIAPFFAHDIYPVKNVIEATMCNMNIMLHPPITIYNAGWIECKNAEFSFYEDGATHGILMAIAELDKERIEVGKALGFTILSVVDTLTKIYGYKSKGSLQDVVTNAKCYRTIKATNTLTSRLITEDMDYAFQPIFEYFAKKYDVKTPIADALLTSARFLTGLPLPGKRDFETFPRPLSEI